MFTYLDSVIIFELYNRFSYIFPALEIAESFFDSRVALDM